MNDIYCCSRFAYVGYGGALAGNLSPKKGYSFFLFLLLAWVISWLFALVSVLLLPNKNAPPHTETLTS